MREMKVEYFFAEYKILSFHQNINEWVQSADISYEITTFPQNLIVFTRLIHRLKFSKSFDKNESREVIRFSLKLFPKLPGSLIFP